MNAAFRRNAAQLGEEVDVKVRAPVFTIGDAAQPELFLEFDDAADGVVLDAPQLRQVDRARAKLLARVEQDLGSQEAADMIGTKRRRCSNAGRVCNSGGIHSMSSNELDEHHRTARR